MKTNYLHKISLTVTFLVALCGVTTAAGQQPYRLFGPTPTRFDVAGGYNFIRANAPPSKCGCFNMNGGFLTVNGAVSPWFSLVGDITATHASNISSLGQNLTLMTLMGGPRLNWIGDRYSPFANVEFGAARGTGSYFPSGTTSSSKAISFAYSMGGGLDMNLTHRVSLRLIEAEYLHTSLPNGVNSAQNQLQIRTGLVFHFGDNLSAMHVHEPRPAPRREEPPPPPQISFSCRAENPTVHAGESVRILGESATTSADGDLSFAWSTDGGVVQGSGRDVAIDTTSLAPGTYNVEGRASVKSNPAASSSCAVSFTVAPKPEPVQNPPAAKAESDAAVAPALPAVQTDTEGPSVKDAFFDYNESELRADARAAAALDAAYLLSHPAINIVVAGYADERGSEEYNVTLGMQRAAAMRDALISAGVESSRIRIISYGKERPFCYVDTDRCYQLNRRAQIVITNGQ